MVKDNNYMGAGVPDTYRYIGRPVGDLGSNSIVSEDLNVKDKYTGLPDDWGSRVDFSYSGIHSKVRRQREYNVFRLQALSLVKDFYQFEDAKFSSLRESAQGIVESHWNFDESNPDLLKNQLTDLKLDLDKSVLIAKVFITPNRKMLTKGRMKLVELINEFSTFESK